MASNYDVLIVGAGHGGAQAAIALRAQKYQRSIAVVGDEPDLPYERPPLSKEYLSGDRSFERILIRPAAFWAERAVETLLGCKVIAVDPIAHRVTLASGETIGYGKLIWAAGGSPRRLSCSGHDLVGVHVMRCRADADQVLAKLSAVEHIVVIGGGYIGLEAAAVLTKLGKHVTVLEALDRVLARVAGTPLSRFYEAEHRAHGVKVRLGETAECIEGRGGKVTGVRLVDGTVLPADLVIVGIGIVPAVEPLLAAGAGGGNGVAVDEHCRTTLADIYAVGDCALHENAFAGGAAIRLESVQNANDQATIAAKTILGGTEPYRAVPWFWSNQYDLRLQTVGLSIGYDAMVVRGNMAARSFSIVYLRRGKVIALDCVNAVRDYAHGKALVVQGVEVAAKSLADVSVPLQALVGGT